MTIAEMLDIIELYDMAIVPRLKVSTGYRAKAKPKTGFMIQDGPTGQYLQWSNPSSLKSDDCWQACYANAQWFPDKHKACQGAMRYLKAVNYIVE